PPEPQAAVSEPQAPAPEPTATPAPSEPEPEPAPSPPAATATAVSEPPAPKAETAMPPRQRTSPEKHTLPDNISELLLSDQGLDETDVTDVAATLVVADLQRSVEFYTDALGLHIVDRTDEAAVLEAGFGKILLWERPDAPPGETGIMHLTFEVGDLDATFAQMNDAGVEFLHLPRTALLGQNYELRAASFRDPDGHGLAITEHRER
ncbi:VOC family protein, partial [Glycomyces tenuis]|uniref:VOC family protein n=1 Tax=Glycomyces tenuis TaxID=58116 RepID=UPI00054E0D6E